jgi:hypothetical protein
MNASKCSLNFASFYLSNTILSFQRLTFDFKYLLTFKTWHSFSYRHVRDVYTLTLRECTRSTIVFTLSSWYVNDRIHFIDRHSHIVRIIYSNCWSNNFDNLNVKYERSFSSLDFVNSFSKDIQIFFVRFIIFSWRNRFMSFININSFLLFSFRVVFQHYCELRCIR